MTYNTSMKSLFVVCCVETCIKMNTYIFKTAMTHSLQLLLFLTCVVIISSRRSGESGEFGESKISNLPTNSQDETLIQGRSCELMSSCDIVGLLETKIAHMERRVRALEQPVWKITSENFRWTMCSQGPCKCYPESFNVNCWRLGLTILPELQKIPADTAVLDMGSNMINALHKHAFRGLTRLIQLDLSDNKLDYLPDILFENLGILKYLMLQRNRLDSLSPAIFRDLTHLETLDLSENLLEKFPERIWEHLQSLRSLQLSRNKLIEWSSFNGLINLENLDVSENALESLGSFRSLRKLKHLKLSGNALKHISETTFLGLRHVEALYLQHNKLEELYPNIFMDLGQMVTVDLSDNLIKEISSQNFNGLRSLKELNLAQNELRTIANGTFQMLAGLERLFLTGNILDSIEPEAFKGLMNLTELKLGNNILSELSSPVLESMSTLTRLELAGNDFVLIPEEAFEVFTELQAIKLGNNPWLCDCNILYLANWIKDHKRIVSDPPAMCREPAELDGQPLAELTFSDICNED